MGRYHIFLLVGVIAVLTLSSCAKSVQTGSEGLARERVVLEDMGNGVCRQFPSGLMWQMKKSRKISTWEEANAYVNTLQLGGFDDWRLPTPEEILDLAELLDIKKGACSIKIKRGLWVNGDKSKGNIGHWEDYPLCAGSEFH